MMRKAPLAAPPRNRYMTISSLYTTSPSTVRQRQCASALAIRNIMTQNGKHGLLDGRLESCVAKNSKSVLIESVNRYIMTLATTKVGLQSMLNQGTGGIDVSLLSSSKLGS